ncbi:olfactory receptor 8I2-like [Conger conger]|uniref:olfactory receptor 8I2-like n=1 Tax=Conger conger TaxID=82655 RepID=UPI002A5A47D8|nr:olfactory receptor 8I2-like [Conger conger]
MELKNATDVSLFTLSGLQDETKERKYVLFSVTLFCYFLIMLINMTLIVTILQEKSLHEPMYIFLCNLCINGLYGTAGFYPKFLYDLLSEYHLISYTGCFLQVFVIYLSVTCDFSILTVMAYDRYVAICKPLEYNAIMTWQTIGKLIVICWFPPFVCECLVVSMSNRLTLCGSKIDKLYCENWSIVRLSCYSTTLNNVIGYVIILTYLGHVFFIFISYIELMKTCLKSAAGRRKFMQTCLPHLFSLINVTVALLFDLMYSRYGSRDMPQGLRNLMALEFLVIPPILNPLIYGIQLTKVREAVLRRYTKRNRIIVQ